MVKKTKGSHRLDKFYHLAKEQGFRSRAAFKLIQLNRQFDFLSKCNRLLDLGAAPGGWLQVATKFMPVNGVVIGVDIVPIKPIRGVKTFIEDITTAKCRATVKKAAEGKLMDVILHDGAPNVGGMFNAECYNQNVLVLESLRICTDLLAPKGTFVTKVFRSQDYASLLYALNQLFEKVDATKPVASRNESAEIFVVCRGYKAPKKVDPRLIDHKTLFVKDDEPEEKPDVFSNSKQKRNRTGYEAGMSLVYKEVAARDFVLSDQPAQMLANYNKISLAPEHASVSADGKKADDDGSDDDDEGAAPTVDIAAHKSTTEEIRALVEDLRVLGKKEFKQLMRWRNDVKKTMLQVAKADAAADADAAAPEDETEEQSILRRMGELQAKMMAKKRHDKKHLQKLKAKLRKKIALGGMKGEATDYADPGLFALSRVSGEGSVLDAIADADAPGAIAADIAERPDDMGSSDEGEARDEWDLESSDDSDADSDDGGERHVRRMEKYIDKLYDHYNQEKEQVGRARRKRTKLGDHEDDPELGGALLGPDRADDDADSDDSDADAAAAAAAAARKGKANPLLVSLVEPKKEVSGSALARQWFNQPAFGGIDIEEDDGGGAAAAPGGGESSDDELSDDEMPPKAAAAKGAAAKGAKALAPATPSKAVAAKGKDKAKGAQDDEEWRDSVTAKRKREAEEQFEEVAMQASDSDTDTDAGADTESEMESDEELRAEDLAMAKKMLRGRNKQDILDAAYNRYNFHETDLPEWFAADERKHMRPNKTCSKQEVEAEKERLQAIDARPIKKVAEAKARKKMRISRQLERAKSKASKVAEQEDMSAGARMREIQRIYAKAQSSLSKKSSKKTPGKNVKTRERGPAKGPKLDRRMLADKRGLKAASKRNPKLAGGKKGFQGKRGPKPQTGKGPKRN